jgi:putative heme-binding domain-containing protein
MRRNVIAAVGLVLAAGAMPLRAQAPQPPALVAPTGPRTPEEERKGFHLPPGFVAELVACEPEIYKPMNLAFDDLGRLWVTSSLEYPFPAKEGTTPRDKVTILDDFGPDGRARRVSTFADGLNIPIGVLPLSPREALVHGIPKVWRLTDADGDGKADRREEAYQSYGFADTHGMTNAFTWGLDGWIYTCHGFANTSTVKGADGRAIVMQSGNTYRMRPDGSRVEWYTHGQVNPFGLAMDPRGNLFSCDCHSRPVYQLLRGAYYPSFGKPHDGLGFGPEMMSHDHGSTGIAGIAYYAAGHFPARWRDTVFVGNVVTSRINHDRLERHGSTLVAIAQPDFLVSEDPWFRPVDIELGPDGALYIADFYNKIIGHYEVPLTHPGRDRFRGRIWRIVYQGPEPRAEPKAPRADWTRASIAELISDLSHENLAVRVRATNELVRRGGVEAFHAAEAVLASKDARPEARAHALWVAERLVPMNDPPLFAAARDRDPLVRVHAMKALGERPGLTEAARDLATAALKDEDAFVRRAAAEALGRHPSADNLRPLLDLRHAVPADDTHLRHAVRMALRDQLVPESSWARVNATAWDQADARALADVALGVPGPAAADFLLRHLKQSPEGPERVVDAVHHVARYGSDPAGLLAFVRGDRPQDLKHQAALLRAIQQGTQERGGRLDPAAQEWAAALVRTLIASARDDEALAGFELAGALKMTPLRDDLIALADSRPSPEPRRAAALAALATLDPAAAIGPLGRALGDAGTPIGLRERAAGLLAQQNRPEARARLMEVLPLAPGRLQTAIAVGLAGTRAGAERLLEAIAAGKASARLLQEPPVGARVRAVGGRDLEARLGALLAGLPRADARLQQLIDRRRAGFAAAKADVGLGAKVFETHCAACHQLAGRGARIGPQLDGIGARGADRLTEDILDPNRNIDQAFRVTTLALSSGQVLSGLLLREEGDTLVLADPQGKEVRVAKGDVEERKVAPLSPMPSTLADQIGEAEFYHLLGYLLSQTKPADPR